MFTKLLKYDLKKSLPFFLIMYAMMLVFAVVGRLCSDQGDTTFILVVGEICKGAVWALIANILINNILRIWAEFRRNLYGDESYLTHTLPVKTSTIYWSKFTNASIILVLNLLVSAAALYIDYGGTAFADMLNSFLPEVSGILGFSTAGLVWTFIGIIFVEMLTIIVVGFIANILGRRKLNHKTGWTAAYIAIIYLAIQVCIISLILLAGLFNSEIFKIFVEEQGNFDLSVVSAVMLVCTAGYVVAIPIISLITAHCLNRGVDVD